MTVNRKDFFIRKYNALINNNETNSEQFSNVRRLMIKEMIIEKINKENELIRKEKLHDEHVAKYDLTIDFGL